MIIKKIIIILCLLMMTGCQKETISYQEKQETVNDYHHLIYDDKDYDYDTSIVNFLFLGTDSSNLQGQSDSVILFSLNREKSELKVFLIPRETVVNINYYDGENAIDIGESFLTMAYSYAPNTEKKVEEVRKIVSKLFNEVPIVNYVVTSITDIRQISEIIGDVDVVLPNDSLIYLDENLKKGTSYTVTKDNIESYLRSRDVNSPNTSYLRLERQEEFLKKSIDKLDQNDNDALLRLIKNNDYHSNLTINEMLSFYDYLCTSKLEIVNIPGEYFAGESYDKFIINDEKLNEIIIDNFYMEER